MRKKLAPGPYTEPLLEDISEFIELPYEVDLAFVEEVEQEVGMAAFAWDAVEPIQICEAVIRVHLHREKRAEGSREVTAE